MGKLLSSISITQAITNIAIVVGLGVVVYELHQNRALMQLQMTSDSFALSGGVYLTGMGEEFPEVYARACTNPDDLSDADAVVLLNYYLSLWNQFGRLRRADFYELAVFDIPVETSLQQTVRTISSTAPGREFYQKIMRTTLTKEHIGIADAAFKESDPNRCARLIRVVTSLTP